jgi:precorrin-3B C17-methyltransferase
VFEAIEAGEPEWRALDVQVIPGVSAMFAAAARIGAPLGHDFCVISLSDNLKPWPVVTARLQAAAAAGFVIALYNARSQARSWQLGAAFDLLRLMLPGVTLVALATSISPPDECIIVTTLAEADPAEADMRTLILIGSAALRRIERQAMPPWILLRARRAWHDGPPASAARRQRRSRTRRCLRGAAPPSPPAIRVCAQRAASPELHCRRNSW